MMVVVLEKGRQIKIRRPFSYSCPTLKPGGMVVFSFSNGQSSGQAGT